MPRESVLIAESLRIPPDGDKDSVASATPLPFAAATGTTKAPRSPVPARPLWLSPAVTVTPAGAPASATALKVRGGMPRLGPTPTRARDRRVPVFVERVARA